MGFNSKLLDENKTFDKDTLLHLSEKPSLMNTLTELIDQLETLMDKSEDKQTNKIQIWIRNNVGEEALINLIGVNATSLVSSEMKGSIRFTFIKELSDIKCVKKSEPIQKRGLVLIKN